MKAGKDFGVASCPERANPGHILSNLKTVPRIIGGINPPSTEVAVAIYESALGIQIVKVRNPKTANAVKLTENVFRDVNIALMNELAVFYQKLDVNIIEVIDACATKWNFVPHYPGAGVGGGCLPTSSCYLIAEGAKMGCTLRLIRMAREINDKMPKHVVMLVEEALKNVGKVLSARARLHNRGRSIIVGDKVRQYYDTMYKEREKKSKWNYAKQRIDAKIVSLLRRIGDKPQRVLEIGIGKGDLATGLVSENNIYMYVGIDITEVGVHIAHRKIKSDFQFLVSDGTYLPFRPNMFDIIICSETIEHITQKEKLMSEMRMVLRTKGFLILTTPNPDRQLLDIVPNILSKIPKLSFRSKQVIESPLDRHELADLLENGKFKIIYHGGLIFQSVLFSYLEGLFRRSFTSLRWISEHLEEKNLLPSLSFYQVVLARVEKDVSTTKNPHY